MYKRHDREETSYRARDRLKAQNDILRSVDHIILWATQKHSRLLSKGAIRFTKPHLCLQIYTLIFHTKKGLTSILYC
jgi:hypothetical protein